MTPIPLATHPHILDAILSFAPHSSLLALRTASRALRDRVDTLLVTHIAFLDGGHAGPDDAGIRAVHKHAHVRIPREQWWDVEPLADAVRVVDICPVVPHALDSAPSAQLHRQSATAKLHCVSLVRRWAIQELHPPGCSLPAAPRTVTFLPPMATQLDQCIEGQRSLAPTAVFVCAPGEIRADVWGLGSVVIRAQPAKRNLEAPTGAEPQNEDAAGGKGGEDEGDQTGASGTDNAVDPTILCLDLACAMTMADGVTLVGWDAPFLRAWSADCGGDVRAKITRSATAALVLEHYAGEDEAPKIVESALRMVSEDQYRAEVGEEVYALEAYCAPVGGW